jgi:hypothetical protein
MKHAGGAHVNEDIRTPAAAMPQGFGTAGQGRHGSQAVVPSLHHRKEGWLRPSIKWREASLAWAQTGWFSSRFESENHPGLAISGCFAIIY